MRPITAIVLAATLATAGLAGCIGTSGSDEGLEEANATDPTDEATNGTDLGTLPDGSPVPTETELAGCHEQIGAFPLPEEAFASEVPEGFEPVSFGPLDATVTLVVLSLSCTVDGDDHAETWAMVPVEPPEELASEEADFSALALGAITATERQTATYEAWGLGEDLMDGDVTVETLQEAPSARAGHVLATDGDFTVHVYSGVGGENNPEDAGDARVFGVSDGEVTGAMDVSWTDSQGGYEPGEATLVLEGDSPIPQPQGAGIAVHYWGEDYTITYEHVDLDEAR